MEAIISLLLLLLVAGSALLAGLLAASELYVFSGVAALVTMWFIFLTRNMDSKVDLVGITFIFVAAGIALFVGYMMFSSFFWLLLLIPVFLFSVLGFGLLN